MNMNPRAVIGGNNPPAVAPEVLDPLAARVAQLAETAGQWLDQGEVADDDNASRLNDFLTALNRLGKEVEEARRAAKRPHDEAAKAVQVAFAPLVDALDRAASRLKPLLAGYAERKRAAEEAARAARIAGLEAELADAQASLDRARRANDVIGEAAALNGIGVIEDELETLGRKPVKVQIASATGGGRTMAERTQRRAKLANANLAFMRYREHPALLELLERLATADLRASRGALTEIPGFEIVTERTVA